MRTGERVDLIKKVARTLSEQSWEDLSLVLRQAKVPTPNWSFEEAERYPYCLLSLEDADDGQLVELDDYLHSATHPALADEPWGVSGFRLFVTHVARRKAVAANLKDRVHIYGIDAFVAHNDIEPAKPWQRVIEAALMSCDALVALLHDGFKESNWCDQEVGYVLARNVPVVPVSFDLQPYGFFGALQSLRMSAFPKGVAGTEIARLLLHDARTGRLLTDHMVHALARSRNWVDSNAIAALLASDAPTFTGEHLRQLREAQVSSKEVRGASDVEPALHQLVSRFGLTEP